VLALILNPDRLAISKQGMKQMVANLKAWQLKKLQSFKMVAKDEGVEDEGMDEGRFFVHLTAPYSWVSHGIHHTKSFGNFEDALAALLKFK